MDRNYLYITFILRAWEYITGKYDFMLIICFLLFKHNHYIIIVNRLISNYLHLLFFFYNKLYFIIPLCNLSSIIYEKHTKIKLKSCLYT